MGVYACGIVRYGVVVWCGVWFDMVGYGRWYGVVWYV